MDALAAAALAVLERAYAPYSHFAVGAALEAEDGRVFTACNVENASYGLTICAERAAICAAVAAGARRFRRIVVATRAPKLTPPCGACRQVLREFGTAIEVVLVNPQGLTETHTLADLLPRSFGPEDLAKD